jgi:putative aminopeptidase FrvX
VDGQSTRRRRLEAGLAAAVLLCGAAAGREAGETARRPQKQTDGAFAILETLLEMPGLSGREERVRDAIRGLLPAWAEPEVDALGNLLVGAGPKAPSPEILFVAHMDETGYAVSSVRDDGLLEVRRLGGFFESLYEGQVVLVRAGPGDRGGVVVPRGGDGGTAPADFAATQVRVDVGGRDRRTIESLGIVPGDPVIVPKEFLRLSGSKAAGRAVDDRAGCTALLLALRRIDPGRLKRRVTFAFSVQEEVGLVGAKGLASTLSPSLVVAVDTFVSSDTPVERPAFAHAVLGEGPVIRAIDSSQITDRALVDRVLKLAQDAGLKVQVGLTRGGNDGSAFLPRGARSLALSWPGVHSHSAVEVIDERDLRGLGELVRLIAERF